MAVIQPPMDQAKEEVFNVYRRKLLEHRDIQTRIKESEFSFLN